MQKIGAGITEDFWKQIFKESDFQDFLSGRQIQEITNHWREIAGSGLAGHSKPNTINGQTLVIDVDHSIFAQQISLLQKMLLAKIQQLTGLQFRKIQTKVRKISFTVGSDNQHHPPEGDIIQNIREKTPEELEILKILGGFPHNNE